MNRLIEQAYSYYSNEIKHLKSLSKLHSKTSSPDVCCKTSFKLVVPYSNNATGNQTPKKARRNAKPVSVI